MGSARTIEVIGQVDEHHRLSAEVPGAIQPGLVKLTIRIPADGHEGDEDSAGAVWIQGVSREWAQEMGDAREDIYTLADGDPME